MESIWGWAVVPLAVLAGTAWLGGIVLAWLQRRAILDHPGERSSHQTPVPRGGGLALVPMTLFAWAMLDAAGMAPPGTVLIIAVAALLAFISWRDDLGGLGVGWRFLAHLLAAIIGVLAIPQTQLVFQNALPPLLDRAVAVLLWVWFLNLYNFMDGIDGITCIETLFLGLGMVLVALVADRASDGAPLLALAVAAGAAGFLRWNWPPARMFLGDIGSIPLGYVMGWLLLSMAAKGLWAPALILPLYYLADATITLARRLARGERVWQAHRQHFYQRALTPDGDHRAVLHFIIGGNIALLALAAFAVARPWLAMLLGILATATLLAQLARRARLPRPARGMGLN
jgi:UDP-N-acetylmuramyl pentapeptide phosphotransferase/UDP-N-acetylglucosamine-1-phosphate transferase